MKDSSEFHMISKIGLHMSHPHQSGLIEIVDADFKWDKEYWDKIEKQNRISRIKTVLSILIAIAISPFWIYGYLLLTGYISVELKPIMSPIMSMLLGVLLAMLIIATFMISLAFVFAFVEFVSKKIQKHIH